METRNGNLEILEAPDMVLERRFEGLWGLGPFWA